MDLAIKHKSTVGQNAEMACFELGNDPNCSAEGSVNMGFKAKAMYEGDFKER